MTISSTTNRNDYIGDGATGAYNYSFRIFQDADLTVTIRDTDDAEASLTITTDYTVAGAGDSGGGSITLVEAGQDWMDGSGNLKSNYELTIQRVLSIVQNTDIRNQGDYYPEGIEDQFDKQVMIDQQQQDELDRSVKLPPTISSSEFDPSLPSEISDSTDGSDRVLVTNGTATALIMGPTTTEIINAEANATASGSSADEAEEWANKTDGIVEATEYSAKAWAVGGTDVTETASRGASKEWATKTDNPVDTSEFSAKEYAQGTQASTGGSSKNWASQTGADVTGASAGDMSSKEWAVGTLGRGVSGEGSAKDWATYTSGTVDDTEFSAKKYATDAATSESNAAATVASAFFRDTIRYVNTDSPVTLATSDNGKLHVFDSSGGAITVNLPEISGETLPFNLAFLCTTAGNDITLNRGGASDTINGSSTKVLNVADTGFQLIADDSTAPDTWDVLEFGTVSDGAITRAKLADGAVADLAVRTETTTYTADATTDDLILADTSGGDWTLTLPAASGNTGKKFTIKKTTDANKLTIDGDGSETIDGETTWLLVAQYSFIELICDGSNWHILNEEDLIVSRYYRTTSSQGISTTTEIVDFNGESYDTSNSVTTGASWAYSIPKDGRYKVRSHIEYTGDTDWIKGENHELSIYLAAAEYSSQYTEIQDTDGNFIATIEVEDVVNGTAGQDIDIRARVQNGGTSFIPASETTNFVIIEYLGR